MIGKEKLHVGASKRTVKLLLKKQSSPSQGQIKRRAKSFGPAPGILRTSGVLAVVVLIASAEVIGERRNLNQDLRPRPQGTRRQYI
jgi:hypothetical protein